MSNDNPRMPRSATFWVTTQTTLTQLISLALFAIQAPLLGPRAFGLISIVMVFIVFCETVLTDSATDALISIPKVETLHYSTMTSINLLLAAAIAGTIVVFAVPIAHMFDDQELVSVLRWMAVLPIISAFASAPNAATKRAHQFRPLAIRAIVGTLAGGIVGIVLTLLGMGVWALVWQAIIQRASSVIILWLAVRLEFRLQVSSSHFKALTPFLAPLLLARSMRWGGSQIPRFLLGLYMGAAELGLFSLASRLCDLLTQVTVVPKYAVLRLELRRFAIDNSGLEDAVRKSILQMSFLYFPIFTGAAAVMPTLFRVWLDARWFKGIVPAELMLLMGISFVTIYAVGALLTALNLQRTEALLSVVDTVLTVIALIVAAPFGVIVAISAFVARSFAMLPLTVELACRRSRISARSLVLPQLLPATAAALMGAVVWILGEELRPVFAGLTVLMFQVVAGLIVYALLSHFMLPQLTRSFWLQLRERFPRHDPY